MTDPIIAGDGGRFDGAPDPRGPCGALLEAVGRLAEENARLREELARIERTPPPKGEIQGDIYENVPVGLFRATTDVGRVLACNEELVRLLGCPSREQLLKQYVVSERCVDAGAWVGILAKLKADGQIMDFDVQFRKCNGSRYWARLSARLLSEENCLDVAIVDVTEEKRTLDSLHESEKFAVAGRMTAIIAHEINNPLAGIKNSFLLIKDAIARDHPYYDCVERIEHEIDWIARVVSKMYDLRSPEQEVPAQFDLDESIDDVVALLEAKCRRQSVRINTAISRRPMPVRLPKESLFQILFNVIQNAVEATPAGGFVAIIVERIDRSVKVSVADEGDGIAEDIRSRVFEPFFTTKADGGSIGSGRGLGLAIARRLTDNVGGDLEFESKVGRGTVFRITLPVERPGGETEEAEEMEDG